LSNLRARTNLNPKIRILLDIIVISSFLLKIFDHIICLQRKTKDGVKGKVDKKKKKKLCDFLGAKTAALCGKLCSHSRLPHLCSAGISFLYKFSDPKSLMH
jgi:hypothetical protein